MSADRSRLPSIGPDPDFAFPAIEKRTLDNGLQVWTVEHTAVPLVSLLLLLPAGAAADPPDRPGLASLTGDLVDEGAGDLSAIELHETLARIGARLDIDVGADASTFALSGLARFSQRAFEVLADLVLRPRFDAAEFERVRERRLSRLLQLRDMPPAVADRTFIDLIYPDHPYGHLAVGTEESLRRMTLGEVVDFHRRAYTLSRATLIVVGDGSHERFAGMARRAFGERQAAATDPAADAATLPRPGTPACRFAIVDRPGAAQSELRIGHVATARNSPDYHALLVLNTVLGGQFVSRLNLKLREEKGYTYGARTSFDFRRGPGPFVLQVSVGTESTAEAIRDSLAEIRAIRDARPPTCDELAGARAALTRGYPRNFETAGQIARGAAQLSLYELPDDYFSTFVPRVRSVDAQAVARAARAHIDPDRLVSVMVGDRARVLASLEAGGLGPLTVLEPA
jgi:predicted Zn-dependent peptidase